MDTILVLNVGSSSVKFAVAQKKTILLHGVVDHFGSRAEIDIVRGAKHDHRITAAHNLRAALFIIQEELQKNNFVPTVIAHRIVHGGQRFSRPAKLSTSVIHYLRSLIELAPLHQPANLLGVEWSRHMWPRAKQWGVFDTAIYRHLSPSVRTYALPMQMTKRLHIEKYGFHGTSHAWAFTQATKKLGRPAKKISAVTVHLGSGASMTLWRNGRPVDTTMGFTPLEGLVMSTRSGDIDPAIPRYIQKKLGWSAERVTTMLEERSGLVGISGLKDMRDILGATGHRVAGWPQQRLSAATRANAQLALDVFIYHLRRTLSGYLGLLDHPQAVIFTGPVGENPVIQKMLLRNFPVARGIRRLTVPADEERAIVDTISA